MSDLLTTAHDTGFGPRLTSARQRRGLTQKDLASMLQVDPRLVRYYESRAPAPKVDFVHKCAAALGISVDELIGKQALRRYARRGPQSSIDRLWLRVTAVRPRRRATLLRLIELLLPEFERKQPKS